MIGILLRSYSKKTIEEFFQLFKTPCGYFDKDKEYQVIISDDLETVELEAKLIIILKKDKVVSDYPIAGEGDGHSATLLEMGGVVFPVYTGIGRPMGGASFMKVKSTGESAGSLLEYGNKRVLYLSYNIFDEFRYLITNGQPLAFSGIPTLDIHIENLRKWIIGAGLPLVEIPPVPRGYKFFGCLTHDVDFVGIKNHMFDRTLAGFAYRALIGSLNGFIKGKIPLKNLLKNWIATIRLPFIFLGLTKDFWYPFKEYIEIEKGANSTFFFIPFKGICGKINNGIAPNIRAVKYDIDSISSEIELLLVRGYEVGVHGIDSWIDIVKGKEEFKKIEKLVGSSFLGVRMHWLYFGAQSFSILEKVGYSYDSTKGYNETIGYRCGTLQAFKPIGVSELLELPMHIMDTALFYPDRMNLDVDKGLELIFQLIREAVTYGGALTFNWHCRSIAPERLWGDVYKSALNELRLKGAKLSTAENVIRWFRKRRAVSFEVSNKDDLYSGIRVIQKLQTAIDDMILRVYPQQYELGQGIAYPIETKEYHDMPIDGQMAFDLK